MSKTDKKLKEEKKKTPWGSIIVLLILLALLGWFISVYVQDESQLGICQSEDECGRYNVFYIKGSGYVCANVDKIASQSIKSRILMFKYAGKKAVNQEPSGCSCIESRCEVSP